jgi:hypothetical protein
VPEVELNPSKSTSTQTISTCKIFQLSLEFYLFFLYKVRKLLEQMDKVLYFRSSPDPLILDEEQREVRRKGIFRNETIPKTSYVILARIESLKRGSGIMVVRSRTLPELTSSSNRNGHGVNRNDLGEKIN